MIKGSQSTFDSPVSNGYEKPLFLLIFFLRGRIISNHQYKAKEVFDLVVETHDYVSSNPNS